MKMLSMKKDGETVCENIEDASTFFRRFMGLMYRKEMPDDHGLLLTPCSEIHTFGMRFNIDTIALSEDGTVLFVDKAVKPNKIRKKVPGCCSILELNSGRADFLKIEVGDVLRFE